MVEPIMEQPISTNQNQFGFSQKNEMYIPGLEMLMHLNEVTIKQIWPGCLERKFINLGKLLGKLLILLLVIVCSWEYAHKYQVLDDQGNQVYFLREESTCFMRTCCANSRE